MAHSILPHTYRNGFKQPSNQPHWEISEDNEPKEERPHYELPPSVELLTSSKHNSKGFNVLRTWPTLYDGTASPHGTPEWWSPSSKVDVLICGAGPSGLEVAVSLLRQGLTFRIIDKATGPLVAGRADGVQPRFLETLACWGIASEVHEEGPLIERTAIYLDGQLLHHGRSHQSDSRYRGLHIITQGQVERIYIRDLVRHKILVERNTILKDYSVDKSSANDSTPDQYPVRCVIENSITKQKETIEAKFLVGSDGAASSIRKSLDIPFDGISTDIYWGIIDCIFETDYPHAWIFGSVVSTKYGGCVIIPRENGYIRLYTQLDTSKTSPLAASRQARDPTFAESGGQIDVHSITPEEVLDQANRIFAPYKLTFGAPVSWFAIWKISERVARSFSSEDLRVHLVGDAAVMGAFGLNASILDAANLAWKLGLCVTGDALMQNLLPTYDRERRLHGNRIIEVSGKYLRFVCRSQLPPANLYKLGADLGLDTLEGEFAGNSYEDGKDPNLKKPAINGAGVDSVVGETQTSCKQDIKSSVFKSAAEAKAFLGDFFHNHGSFLLGVDGGYGSNCVSPHSRTATANEGKRGISNGSEPRNLQSPVLIKNGVRAPNPRVCFDADHTGYLYDKLTGASRFHLVIFASDMLGPVRKNLSVFSSALSKEQPNSFYWQFGGPRRFNIVVIAKGTPFEVKARSQGPELQALRETATFLSDDRAPDEDAHSTWGANHHTGAAVVIRPDLWVGINVVLNDVDRLSTYFAGFLSVKQ